MFRRSSPSGVVTAVVLVWTVVLAVVLVGLPGLAVLSGLPVPAGLAMRKAAAQETPGLSDARARARAATQQISDLQAELAGLEDDVTQLEADRADAEARMEDLRSRVREVAVRRYTEVGQQQIFIPGADINEQQRGEALANIVNQTDTDAIDEYRATRDRLERTSAALGDKQSKQQARLEDLQKSRVALDAELSRLEALEATRVEAERRAAEDAARQAADAKARDDAATQAEQLKGLQDATQAGKSGGSGAQAGTGTGAQPAAPGPTAPRPTPNGPPAPPIASGPFVCPVQGPRSFVDSFGAPRASGNRHQGVDLMSPRGTPVVIPVSGNVVTKSGGIGGLQFHLQGDDGNFYYGAHMDSFSGAQGHLPAGTVVGYVGDTGDAKGTGTHLHFEIHIGGYGHPIDPYQTVSRYC